MSDAIHALLRAVPLLDLDHPDIETRVAAADGDL